MTNRLDPVNLEACKPVKSANIDRNTRRKRKMMTAISVKEKADFDKRKLEIKKIEETIVHVRLFLVHLDFQNSLHYILLTKIKL